MVYKKSKKKFQQQNQEGFVGRVKLPKGKQTFGILEQRLGGSRTMDRSLEKTKH